VRRLFLDIDDISVDVPSALTLLEKMISKMKAAGTVSNELAAELPSRLECMQRVTVKCYMRKLGLITIKNKFNS